MCSETTPAAAEGTRLLSLAPSRAERRAAGVPCGGLRRLYSGPVGCCALIGWRGRVRCCVLPSWYCGSPLLAGAGAGNLPTSALAARSKQTVSFLRKHRVQRVGFLSVTLNALALWLAVSGVHDCAITVDSCGLRNAPIAHRDVRFHGRVHDCRCQLGASFGQQPLNRRVLLDS